MRNERDLLEIQTLWYLLALCRIGTIAYVGIYERMGGNGRYLCLSLPRPPAQFLTFAWCRKGNEIQRRARRRGSSPCVQCNDKQ